MTVLLFDIDSSHHISSLVDGAYVCTFCHTCSCHDAANYLKLPCLKALPRPKVARQDNYTVYIDDVRVTADRDQQARIEELDDQQLRSLKQIFGG